MGLSGRRLRSVVLKPLVSVQNNPFIYYPVKNWTAQGIKSFVFLLYNQADLIIEFIGKERNGLFKSCEVNYLIEPHNMGIGGVIAYAIRQFNWQGAFLIADADTLLGSGIEEIISRDSPTMAVVEVDACGRYGSVQINDNYINSIKEKSMDSGSGWINAVLSKLDIGFFKN